MNSIDSLRVIDYNAVNVHVYSNDFQNLKGGKH